MRASVAESFVGFTRDLEGSTTWMYLDRLGYVTTGFGDLIDTTAAVCALPWRRPDGSFATRDDVLAEWAFVRSLRGIRNPHGVLWTDCGGLIFANLTKLRLDASAVDELVRSTMARNDVALAKRYGEAYEDWPGCAQMAVHSLAWACGSAYDFPHMDAALAMRDFDTASREIEMTPEHNPGNDLTRRNAANEILMRNAARVQAYHLDPDLLDWTHVLAVSDAPTVPHIPDVPSDPTICVDVDEPILHPIPDTVSDAQDRDG